MAKLENYQKQAKLLVRWHRERNHSIGGKVRRVARFSHLSDVEILAMRVPLTLAQEVVAVEAGFSSWADLKATIDNVAEAGSHDDAPPRLTPAVPILFVREVASAAEFYAAKLGFEVDFLHGKPPFYGALSRDGARLHLRHVSEPNFAELAKREHALILATIETTNVKALFAELERRGAPFVQRLTRQAWGGLDFQVCDPDGNRLSFVEHRNAPTADVDAGPTSSAAASRYSLPPALKRSGPS